MCNAGIVRDRMLVNMSVDEWDAVIRVHLRGLFCPVRHAIGYWRDESKAGSRATPASSPRRRARACAARSRRSNYVAAKAGIAAFTINAAAELGRYGVIANTIAPSARSRMTEEAFAGDDGASPRPASTPWTRPTCRRSSCGSAAATCDVTGRVFEMAGGEVCVMNGWSRGRRSTRDAASSPPRSGAVLHGLVAEAPEPEAVHGT